MSRATISRRWTETEAEVAGRIVDAVALGEGRLVGALSVARAIGLPVPQGRGQARRIRQASLQRVYDLMPLAVTLAPTMYPGKALQVHPRYRVYALDDAQDVARRLATRRAKGVRTKTERMLAEVAPLRGSTDPQDRLLVHQVEVAVSAMSPDVWDVLIARAEAEVGS